MSRTTNSHQSGTSDDDAAGDLEQIGSGLQSLAAYLRSRQWQAAGGLGLTPTQTGILQLLVRRGASGLTVLAARLGVTQATASEAVSTLVRKGMVRRLRDPRDGRAILLELTDHGRELACSAARPPHELGRALGTLSRPEAASLRRALVKLVADLQQSGAIAPQRHCLGCRFFRPYLHRDAAMPHHCAFVDRAFGDASLRLDCADHDAADPAQAASNADRFSVGTAS